jgi:PAS domain S-box-containing protein
MKKYMGSFCSKMNSVKNNLNKLFRTRLFGLILVVFVVGALVSWATAYHTDRRMRTELLEKARIISRMVNTESLGRLSGTEADLKSDDYLKLKTRLMEVRQATAKCRFVYLMGQNSEGKIFFYVDSEPAGSKDESPPGQIYDEASVEQHRVFSTGQEEVDGPTSDRWGTWVSATVPLFDAKSNKTIALGMDIDAREWKIVIASRVIIPAAFTVVILILIISVWLAHNNCGQVSEEKPVLRRLMLPLAAAMFILVSSFGGALLWRYNKNINQTVSSKILAVPADFEQRIESQTENLSIAAQPIVSDTTMFSSLKSRDKERLLSLYGKRFDTMREKYGITHFYFHSPDLVNILRVHKPDEYGDLIDRFIANEAKRTGKTASGIELGPLGTFTLRVVEPVFEGDELIGFVELGKDIRKILGEMQKNSGVDIAVIIFKEKLTQYKLKTGMATLYQSGDWGRLPNDILIYYSKPQLPVEFNSFISNKGHTDSEYKFELTSSDIAYQAAFLPIRDASGSQMGHFLVVYDISRQRAEFLRFLGFGGAGILLLLSLIFSFIYVILSRTDKSIESHGRMLRESEERLKKVLNAAQDAIIMLNHEGRISIWNASAERIFGYTHGQILGQTLHKLAPDNLPKDHSTMLGAFRRSKGGQVIELNAKRSNNEIFPAELSFSVVPFQGGWHSIVILRDITERKQAEEALRQNEAMLSRAFAAAPVSIILLKNRIIRNINGRFSEILGYSAEELIGQSTLMLYSDKAEYERIGHELYTNLRPCGFKNVETQWRRKDGRLIYVLLNASALDPNNPDAGEIGTILDITERRHAELALQHSEERLKTVIRAAQDAIIMLNPDGKISMWNDSAERIFGYTIDQALNQNLHKLLAPARFHEDHLRAFTEFRHSGQGKVVGHVIELTAMRKNGEEFPIELSLSAVHLQDGWRSIGVVRDITERKHVEERLQKALAESAKLNKNLEESMAKETELAFRAETANAAKSRFLANMSHEIRTPMNAIIGFSDLLAEDDLTDEQIKNINIIREAGHNLLELINDILDLSKIEAGKINVEIMDWSLDKLLVSVESLMGLKAKEKGLEFRVIYGGNLPAQIRTDPARLHQCLVNLIGNAVKFTNKGHIYLTVSLEDGDGKQQIRFDVEDTGIGIPPDKLEVIFEAFEQADGSHTRKYGGTGLGLSITKQLAELLGGKVTVSSEVGRGSVFSLMIPAGVNVTRQPVLSHHNISCVTHLHDNKNEQAVVCSGRVLVAEDAPTNQALIKALLGRLGLSVTIANDGQEVVEKAKTGHFDLIFMDMQMPNMNGCDATRVLRQGGLKAPIVALTANVIKGDDQRCFEAGCDDYLPKPIDRLELKRVITKYLSSQKKDSTENVESPEKQWAETSLVADSKAVISWSAIMEQCGNEDVVKEIVGVFLTEAIKYVDSLAEAVKTGNAKDIRFFAHKLKGSSAYVAAGQLVEKAQQLELAGMRQDMDAASPLFEQVREEFAKVISFLSQPDWDHKAKQQVSNVEEKQTC